MHSWHAFVDESGLFDAQDPCPVLAALVVETADVASFHEWARAQIEQAVPHVSWPPHTTYLNLPIYHAFSAVACGVASAQDELVVDVVRNTAGEWADRLVARLRDRRRVHRDGLAAHEEWIRRQQGEAADALVAIEVRLREGEAAIREVLAKAGRQQAALAASAAETFDCEAIARQRGRYFVVLDALIERIHDAVARRGDDATVTVSALELDVDVDERTRRRLDGRLLAEAVDAVAALKTGGRVKLAAGDVVAYDRYVHGGFVLADFVANRFGAVLRQGTSLALERAQQTLLMRLSVPVRSGSPEGSHLAASGAAQVAITELRAGRRPAWPVGSRAWAQAQARQWGAIPA